MLPTLPLYVPPYAQPVRLFPEMPVNEMTTTPAAVCTNMFSPPAANAEAFASGRVPGLPDVHAVYVAAVIVEALAVVEVGPPRVLMLGSLRLPLYQAQSELTLPCCRRPAI